ncbi:unnamed protein product [Phytophthora fragariaefolia]|uniref:Unnamed protein product n=1 Tax=Phytophthora fragariaefolia TaxID=1490495 RepID=A0A9W6TY01_9STRA|nr:unnamed protein product [Phytophthora fragariaefolia]
MVTHPLTHLFLAASHRMPYPTPVAIRNSDSTDHDEKLTASDPPRTTTTADNNTTNLSKKYIFWGQMRPPRTPVDADIEAGDELNEVVLPQNERTSASASKNF